MAEGRVHEGIRAGSGESRDRFRGLGRPLEVYLPLAYPLAPMCSMASEDSGDLCLVSEPPGYVLLTEV